MISLTDSGALADLKEQMTKHLSCIEYLKDKDASKIEEFFGEYHITNAVIVKKDFDKCSLVVRRIKA